MAATERFLLSAAARTLSLKGIYKGGEDAARATFAKLRWPTTDGAPVCPHCGGLDPYDIPTRRRFKCRACGKQFSVTSGTIFASRKLAFTDLGAAICIFVNAVKGVAALQLSRDLDVQYKTAFVLAHKLREALASETEGMTLDGEVEVDGRTLAARSARRTVKRTGSTPALSRTSARNGASSSFASATAGQ